MFKSFAFAVLLGTLINSSYAGTMGRSGDGYNIDGFYVGLGTGLATFFVNDHYYTTLSTDTNLILKHTDSVDSAVLFEGHLGYGRTLYQNIYLGAKAAVYYSPVKHLANETNIIISDSDNLITNNNVNQIILKPVYTIDALIGFEMAHHLMPFIEGGVNFANISSHDLQNSIQSNFTTHTNYSFSTPLNSNGNKTGGNIGLGLNYQISKHWDFSSELIYYYLGKQAIKGVANIPGSSITETFSTKRTFELVTLFASVSYVFSNT